MNVAKQTVLSVNAKTDIKSINDCLNTLPKIQRSLEGNHLVHAVTLQSKLIEFLIHRVLELSGELEVEPEDKEIKDAT